MAFPNFFVGTDILWNMVNIMPILNIVIIKCIEQLQINIILISFSRIQFGVSKIFWFRELLSV